MRRTSGGRRLAAAWLLGFAMIVDLPYPASNLAYSACALIRIVMILTAFWLLDI